MSSGPAEQFVKAFRVLGAILEETKGAEWQGDCPFCIKPGHLFARPDKGAWHCKRCGVSGDLRGFVDRVYKQAIKTTSLKHLQPLAEHRKLPEEILRSAGVAWHSGVRRFLVPGRNGAGKILDVRRYDPARRDIRSVPGCAPQLFGAPELAAAAEGVRVWLCEGEWDGMAMRWLLGRVKGHTSDVVVAVPGAGTLKPEWIPLFGHKRVIAAYDADEAGVRGAERARKLLSGSCKSIEYIRWPDDSPQGWDIRDHVTTSEESPEETLRSLMTLVSTRPPSVEDDAADDKQDAKKSKTDPGERLKPISWKELLQVYESQILMTSDIQKALLVSLSVCVASTSFVDDPLWLYLVGAPGSGKTMLLTSLADAEVCVFRSTLTPHSLISGWREKGGADPSLIPKLVNKTLVVKDFTEVLSLPIPAQEEIYGALREAFDGTVQKSYGNGVSREYHDCRFAILAGVTPEIHAIRNVALGERFLQFALPRPHAAEASSVIRAALTRAGQTEDLGAPLREVACRFLARKMDSCIPVTGAYVDRLEALVQIIAFIRAQVSREKYSKAMLYRPGPELATRLAKQLVKLAGALAHVLKKGKVDDEIYTLVERVAMDTAAGWGLEVFQALLELGGTATRAQVVMRMGVPSETIDLKLSDLQALGVVDAHQGMTRGTTTFEVSPEIKRLWKQAKGGSKRWTIRRR